MQENRNCQRVFFTGSSCISYGLFVDARIKGSSTTFQADAQKMEEWARAQNASTIVDFASREGEIDGILKDIAERT